MRLSESEVTLLKNKLIELSPDAKLYLFGSRVDDSKRGGDIDLLVVSQRLTKKDLRRLRLHFFDTFGEQKLDIILDDGSFSNPFHKIVFSKAVQL